MGKRESYEPGTFCWVDLTTTDAEGAKAFYGDLFGWEFRDDEIPDGVYTKRHGDAPSFWLPHFTVPLARRRHG
jgi:predicted enzyme related to lactoylglutathione lyase